MLCYSLWAMTGWTPDLGEKSMIINTVIQGAGMGMVFIPLQVAAFATLAPEFRTDATSLLSLFRNVGSAIGLSVCSSLLARNQQILHSQLGENITPFNRALQTSPALSHAVNPATQHGAIMLDQMINHQAEIIAYLDDFKFMLLVSLPTLLLLLLMRRPRQTAGAAPTAHAVMD